MEDSVKRLCGEIGVEQREKVWSFKLVSITEIA